jgi:2-polyprenyl-6-methoxyphenol hydroxylase-like FAD-dependent oxidoreductase
MLASQGLRVALVSLSDAQKSAHGHSDVRAYSLNAASKKLLTDLRCWPEDTACTPILRMHIEGDQGGNLEFSAAQQGVEALNWMIDVPSLENNLAKAIGFQPLIQEVSVSVKAHTSKLLASGFTLPMGQKFWPSCPSVVKTAASGLWCGHSRPPELNN